ncbi:potassium channel family protein [Sanguibacter antarcticus]|uniref:Voltage-gated potassium channel n=1 Tax=Sanguibacter antarcticus TaxID=372484 RepID=A0A2A9EA33_9MICO|nr:potassium channel family protein [Sanguibacter antarcticus]PFG35125.1 voltage-gated potassium channel [Sanguibacter antarcticus]
MNGLQQWEAQSERTLTVAALAFLGALAVPIIWPAVGEPWVGVLAAVVVLTWLMFGVDYVIRLWLSEDRRGFFLHNLVDLAVLLLPMLQPLRLLRLVTLLSVLNRTGSSRLRGRVVTYAVGGTGLLTFCGALAITDAERGVDGATVTGFGSGLWWAITTLTTVGYGDTYPVTVTGRLVAAVLMVAGIALLGIVTATLASWLVERVSESAGAEQAATRSQVDALAAEVRGLRRELAARDGRTDDSGT